MPTQTGNQWAKKNLFVTQVDEHEWMFEYPRLSDEAFDEFHYAIDLWRAGDISMAEAEYRRLIAAYPEFIDARHHLAMLLDETGRGREAFQIWQETVDLGSSCLPDGFAIGRDRLPWLILENRPFLRAYHGLGLAYLERNEVETALSIFDNVLAMNPNDNQGVRALAIDCNFHLRHPKGVLEICDQYPGDGMEQVIYGRVLALYQLGHKSKARSALRDAIDFLPLVAKELAKARHRRPKNMRPGYITHGGADQAYTYWIDQGQHWKSTPGAIDLVRECLQ